MKLLNLIACFLLATGPAVSQPNLQIVSSNVEKVNNAAAISWTPSNEAGTNYFEIQKSDDGVNWKVIAIMFPFEDTIETHSYRYNDKSVGKEGSYYRIREIAMNKKKNFSNVMVVDSATTKK